ncbi:MAG: DUF4838 domain-containing protein [Oscillospiraceae bacterium]|nr:DUF4838 domain-containing protein [Oscillospiraceae bacterium]
MKLALNHTAHSRIVVAQNADSVTRYAAEELQRWLGEMAGTTFPLVSDALPPSPGDILVGENRRTASFAERTAVLPKEGFFYCTEGDTLVFGGQGRGLLYGVYAFLEDELGIRFYTPEVTHVPRRSHIEIGSLDRTDTPVMEYREPSIAELRNTEYAVRRRCNGMLRRELAEKYGGGVGYAEGYFVHTFTRLLPPDLYFDDHPEYYSEIGGQRIREKTQLCLSNPDVLELVKRRVLEELRKQPQAALFSVSQDDNYNGCTCEKCRAVDEAEGSMAGSMIRFVNAVAEAVEEEFPHVVIDTLAYQYTRKPPKLTRPRHNVSVRLCSIECCFVHPLRQCRRDDPDAPNIDLSQPFAEDLIGWGKMCNRLYVWDYVTNFSHYWMPHPNFHVLADNVRFFAENGVKGVFEQGCAAVGGGEFTGLRAYLLSKALWNPDLDENLVIDEYLTGVYGAAGPWLRKYLETVYNAVNGCGSHLYCFNHPDKPWHTMALVEACEAIFDEAEKVAPTEEILLRVRKQRLAVKYLRILLTPKGTAERASLIEAFTPEAKAFGLTMLWERENMDFCLRVLLGQQEPGYWWAK